MHEVDEQITAINILSRRLTTYLDKVLAPLALSASTYYFLIKIDQAGQLTQDQLFQRVFLNPSNVTRRLDQLTRQGLVERTPDPTDRRARIIRLTPAGQARLPQIDQALRAANATLFAGLSTAQTQTLQAAFAQISQNLDTTEVHDV
ncbi:MarR family winged helix-turn-helix transcriptional regulator [Lacticaseibacillus absianus]|uniref:MarR family winged helix-turn-helix transcriptional regulator n=1 Tax=Lacticaseibacillus absianus TaxID=2729623 RepID=UPI0015CB6B5B|nr:MarR family transcriptional regulator [Lacticaseibacillus absianus]